MKKIALSIIVIVVFILDSLYDHAKGIAETPIIAPKNISVSENSPSATPIATQTPIPPTNTPTPTGNPQNTPANTPIPQSTPTNTPIPPSSEYKDGTYTGDGADAFYGTIQVQATISGGKITNIQFLQSPNDRGTSIAINEQADPMLAQEAIQTQNAQVNIISGATDSSQAFIQSLQTALDKAKN